MNATECAVCKATWRDKTDNVQVIDCGECGKYRIDGYAEAILRAASLSHEQVVKLQRAVQNLSTVVNGDVIAEVLRAEERHG